MALTEKSPKELFELFLASARQSYSSFEAQITEFALRDKGYEIKAIFQDIPELTARIGGRYSVERVQFSLVTLDGTLVMEAKPIVIMFPKYGGEMCPNAYDVFPELTIDDLLRDLEKGE